MDKVSVVLFDGTRERAAQAFVDAPDGYVMTLAPPTRSIVQNAMLHALFGAVAKQAKWHGRVLTAVQWKVLFISGHAIATGRGADMVPGLEGEFANIRESSAHMGVARMSSLIEYCLAWCATNGIRLPAGEGFEDLQPRQKFSA
jgi:NinB protein